MHQYRLSLKRWKISSELPRIAGEFYEAVHKRQLWDNLRPELSIKPDGPYVNTCHLRVRKGLYPAIYSMADSYDLEIEDTTSLFLRLKFW